jgi:hypothetical protein
MPVNKLWLVAASVAVVLSSAACDNKGLTNINKNPNSPTSAPPGPVFTRAANLAAQDFLGSGFDQYYMEVVAQQLAEVQYPDVDAYRRLDPASTGGVFNAAYSGEIEDLTQIIKTGRAQNNALIYGPALVLRTWEYGILTDSWGDIPYSQANQGDSSVVVLSPAYDAQKDIYTDIFKSLDDAAKAMAAANPGLVGLGSADIVYGGNMLRWQRFANSLRARHALRVVNVDKNLADTQLRAAFSGPGGVFTGNADAAAVAWPGDNTYNNPWGGDLARDDRRVSNRLIDPLVAMADPRLSVYAQPTAADPTKYVGLQNGMLQSQLGAFVATTSRVGRALFTASTSYGNFGTAGIARPSYLMTFAELSFIQAEAAERSLGGLTPGQAKGFYEAGIRSSFQQWGITDATTISTYLARADVAYKAGTAGLTQIALQKWLALFGDGGQVWAEWRRTCVPNTVKPGPEAIQATVPRRLLYPTTEYAVNADALKAAVARQGSDEFTTRMWWDANPTAAPTYTASCGTR